jgi:lysophospholipase L1-like esterase
MLSFITASAQEPWLKFQTLQNQMAGLECFAPSGTGYRIERSTSLSDWRPAADWKIGTGSPVTLLDTDLSASGFYRLKSAPLQAPWIKVCCVGTSITDGGTQRVNDFEYHAANSHAGWLKHLLQERIAYPPRQNAFKPAGDWDHGYSGATVQQLIAGGSWLNNFDPNLVPVADALATNADVYVLEGGTNDLSGNPADNAAILQRIRNYWDYFRSRGKPVIALTVLPVGKTRHTGVPNDRGTTAHRDQILAINQALIPIAEELGVELIDVHRFCEMDADGFAKLSSLWDGIHPNSAYAHAIAEAVTEVIAPHTLENPEPYIPGPNSPAWLSPNVNPSQNSKPGGWATEGATTFTWSSHTDLYGQTWQRISFDHATELPWVAVQCTIFSGFAEGDVVRSVIRVRDLPGSFKGVSTFNSYLYAWNGTHLKASALDQAGNLGVGHQVRGASGLFISPAFTVPAGTTQLRWVFTFQKAQAATVDLRQCGIFRESP